MNLTNFIVWTWAAIVALAAVICVLSGCAPTVKGGLTVRPMSVPAFPPTPATRTITRHVVPASPAKVTMVVGFVGSRLETAPTPYGPWTTATNVIAARHNIAIVTTNNQLFAREIGRAHV